MDKCGDCVHWHRNSGSFLETGQVQGECRGSPPDRLLMMANDQNGRPVQIINAAYRVVHVGFPACAAFKRRGLENPEDGLQITTK